MRKLDYVLMSLIGLILVLILIVHNLLYPTIKFINDFGGLFTFISVIIILVLFLIERNLENEKRIIEQHNILRNLVFEINKIKEDSDGYKKSFLTITDFHFILLKN